MEGKIMPLSLPESASLLAFAEKNQLSFEWGWKNFSQNLQSKHALVFKLKNITEIQNLLEQINLLNEKKTSADKITMRVSAGGYAKNYSESFSFTPCALADVIIQLVSKDFQKVEVIDAKNHIVKIGAMIPIGQLDKTLYEQFQLSLPTSSLIPYVSFAGLVANAGHGTGRDAPSVAGLMRAMTLLRPDGKIVRVDETHPDFNTIRSSHLGLFGILLEAEIACIPAKKLKCEIKNTHLSGLMGEMQKGLLHQYPYVTVMYIPTYERNEKQTAQANVSIIKWHPQSLTTKVTEKNVALKPFKQESMIRLSKKFFVEEILQSYPHIIPSYMKYIVSTFALKKENSMIGDWPSIAHYQTSYPRKIDDTGYLFAIDKDGKEAQAALLKVEDTLHRYAQKHIYPVTYAIYLRFFQGTQGGLSTSQSEDKKMICAFDIVSNPHIQGYTEFKNEMQDYFITKLHAKPHWGKSIPLHLNYAKIYGESFYTYKNALVNWHKDCKMDVMKSPFLNKFHETILQLPEKNIAPFEREKKSPLTNEKIKPKKLKTLAGKLFQEMNKTEKNNPHAIEFINELRKIK
jgi:hypothetical protein